MPKAPHIATRISERLRRAEEERALLDRVAAGEEDALSLLYESYAPMLLALAMKMLRSLSDSEEIVQELFQDLWRNALPPPDGTLHARLVFGTRERALARLRARGHRRQHHGFDPQAVSLLPERSPHVVPGGEREEIIAALRTAGQEGQQVLALALYEGFTISEIADLLHRPAATVRLQLGDALLALHRVGPWQSSSAPGHHGLTRESYVSRALGILDIDDGHRFEEHLATSCAGCLAYLQALKETAALVPVALAPVPPSADLKERILFSIRLSQVAEEELRERPPMEEAPPVAPVAPDRTEEPSVHDRRSPWLIIAGIFVVLLILVGLAAYVNTLIDKVSAQYAFIQGQEAQLAELKSDLSGKKGVSMVLDSPRLQIVPLKAVPPGVESRGNLFWDLESNRAFLRVLQLPEAPDDMEYRLWIGLKDKSILRSELTSVLGPDSTRTYLTVIRMPDGSHERVDFVAVVRVKKDAEAEATGEMCLQGTFAAPGQAQRTK